MVKVSLFESGFYFHEGLFFIFFLIFRREEKFTYDSKYKFITEITF